MNPMASSRERPTMTLTRSKTGRGRQNPPVPEAPVDVPTEAAPLPAPVVEVLAAAREVLAAGHADAKELLDLDGRLLDLFSKGLITVQDRFRGQFELKDLYWDAGGGTAAVLAVFPDDAQRRSETEA